jgi:hypothetical protein
MAKAQGLALNPSKISGQCGRLLCCLGYEYETYNELRKNLPKCGKKLNLPDGPADVISLNVLAQKITVADKDGRREIHIDDINKSQKSPVPAPIEKTSQPPAKTGDNDKPKNDEAGASRRPRRRGGRSNTPRNPDQKTQSSRSKQVDSNQPTATKTVVNPADQQKDEQKTARPRRRNRRRPKRRPEQGTPQDQN